MADITVALLAKEINRLNQRAVEQARIMADGFEVLVSDIEAYCVKVRALEEENARLQKIIDTHDLCHNLHGKVDARAFADGCAAEQRKLYGCAPDADALQALKDQNDLPRL